MRSGSGVLLPPQYPVGLKHKRRWLLEQEATAPPNTTMPETIHMYFFIDIDLVSDRLIYACQIISTEASSASSSPYCPN